MLTRVPGRNHSLAAVGICRGFCNGRALGSSLRSAVLLPVEARRLRNAREKPASERFGSKIMGSPLSAEPDGVHG